MSARIDRSSAVPIYHQLKQILLEELRAADDAQEQEAEPVPFLTEEALIRRFHISRAPVRQALKELVDEGYLYRERSKGTFRVPGPVRNASGRLGGLVHYLREQGLDPQSRVSDVGRVVAPEHVRALFALPPDGTVLGLTRLILLNDKPLARVRTYLDVPEAFQPEVRELEEAGTIFVLLERDLGITLPRGEQQIWATAATHSDARELDSKEGDPILVTTTTMHTREGRAAGWSRIIHRGDEYKYVFPVTR